ncbi:acyl-CoA thioesterase [Sorangium cellulosum]|uniref:Thioesterase domain-containing protein n=1 Tax=Sorangium cellulosum So0157-2 TaxID=1254432 RepID=S4XQ30_SORCE|nr:hotdog domain-containing protein [Sorangium cellulosum]AGP35312.1 hypothetical protein SCE1572_12760 [Sorangium cellulosum So0157-2]
MVRRDLHLAVAELRIKYRKAARFGDHLEVETTCREIQRVTARFSYRILRGSRVAVWLSSSHGGALPLEAALCDRAPRRQPAELERDARATCHANR